MGIICYDCTGTGRRRICHRGPGAGRESDYVYCETCKGTGKSQDAQSTTKMVTAKIIHIKNAPWGWEQDPQYVYIGRVRKGHTGYFGNPIKLEKGVKPGSTLDKFKTYLYERCERDSIFRSKVFGLFNKTLVCFCKPKPCHGDIILEYIRRIPEKDGFYEASYIGGGVYCNPEVVQFDSSDFAPQDSLDKNGHFDFDKSDAMADQVSQALQAGKKGGRQLAFRYGSETCFEPSDFLWGPEIHTP